MDSKMTEEVSQMFNHLLFFADSVLSHLFEVLWANACGGKMTTGDLYPQLLLLRQMEGTHSMLEKFRRMHMFKGFVLKDLAFKTLLQDCTDLESLITRGGHRSRWK
jgi:hypothetical protein